MNLNVKSLSCFVAIVDEGTFTAAAKKLHLTQPSLSAQIRMLESHLGFTLFDRTTRRVKLTDSGAMLLPAARQMMEANDRLIRAANSLARTNQQQFKLGAALYTNDIHERNDLVEDFCKFSPEIKVLIDTRHQDALMGDLRRGMLDLCFLLAARVSRAEYDLLIVGNQGREIIYPDDLPAIVIQQERVQLQVPLASPLARYDEIPATALVGQKIVGIHSGYGAPLQQSIHSLLTKAGAELVESPDATSVGIERYGRQMGIASVSLGWLHETSKRSREVIRRPVVGLTSCIDLVLVSYPDVISEPARLFWNFIQSTVLAGRFATR